MSDAHAPDAHGHRSVPVGELEVGDVRERVRTVTEQDILDFARISGDDNPVHVDPTSPGATFFGAIIAHAPLTGGIIGGIIGTELPGLGTVAIEMTSRYLAPVRAGDTITARVEVTAVDVERCRATLAISAHGEGGVVITDGTAVVRPPREAMVL